MKKLKIVFVGVMAVLVSASGALLAAAPAAPNASQQQQTRAGVVKFRQCVEQSKVGQLEQQQFDNMRKQLESSLQEKEKRLTELASKFNDPSYVDSLSPEAEAEVKKEYRALGQEMATMQQQYYQMLNQANVKIIQKLADIISEATGVVAKDRNLDIVFNEDSTFFYQPTLDITADVVKAMDTLFASRPKEDFALPKVDAPAANPDTSPAKKPAGK